MKDHILYFLGFGPDWVEHHLVLDFILFVLWLILASIPPINIFNVFAGIMCGYRLGRVLLIQD